MSLRVVIHIIKRSNLHFYFSILAFAVFAFFLSSCADKKVVKERAETPILIYEQFTHGISPKSTTVKVYGDGYAIICVKNEVSGEENKESRHLSSKDFKGLMNVFIDRDFLDVKPLNMPPVYGGVVITIIFNYQGKSNTIKFLEGTKIPLSVQRCWEKLDKSLF